MLTLIKQKSTRFNKWYYRAKVTGNATLDDCARKLAEICTVDKRDCYAVLMGFGEILNQFMAQGQSVKIDGLGTFYLGIKSKSYDSEAACKLADDTVKAVRVNFIPECKEDSSGNRTRVMVDGSSKLQFMDVATLVVTGGSSTETPSTDQQTGGDTQQTDDQTSGDDTQSSDDPYNPFGG